MKTFKEFVKGIDEAYNIDIKISDKSNEKEARKLIDKYDLYTGAIDDFTQMKRAINNNKIILGKLKDLGVSSFTVKKFEKMYSDKAEDFTINI